MGDPLLILAGLPWGRYSRIKRHMTPISGWDLIVIPSASARDAALDDGLCRRVLEAATSGPAGGHVLGLSTQRDKERSRYAETLKKHVRFRWLNPQMLQMQYLPDSLATFMKCLQNEADFESEWRKSIQPRDDNSPLLLPQSSFAPKVLSSLWTEAAAVAPAATADRLREISKIRKQISSFTEAHRNRGLWLDGRDLLFNVGAPHAQPAAEWWNWKFSWRVPDGFHFDVEHSRGHGFTVEDWEGATWRRVAGAHLNIDCHGKCR